MENLKKNKQQICEDCENKVPRFKDLLFGIWCHESQDSYIGPTRCDDQSDFLIRIRHLSEDRADSLSDSFSFFLL
jgi:hypothetical protein